jgi:hypothetical protein
MWSAAEKFLIPFGGLAALVGGLIALVLYVPDSCKCSYRDGTVAESSDSTRCPTSFEAPDSTVFGDIESRSCDNQAGVPMPWGVGNVSRDQALVVGAVPGLLVAAFGAFKHWLASMSKPETVPRR